MIGNYSALNSLINNFELPKIQPIKRKVFISYHHKNDQGWYDSFSNYFGEQLGLFYDNSLERAEDIDNTQYLNRKIREEYIFGTSVTIVLCGVETYKRRWVDWEIHATLEYEHGLLGIVLPYPYHTLSSDNKILAPSRFFENYTSGFAHWIQWTNNYHILNSAIEEAIRKSSNVSLIENSAPKMQRSSQ